MDKKKLIINIVCGIVVLALVGAAVWLLIDRNSGGNGDPTGGASESGEQTGGSEDAVLPGETGNATDATGSVETPTVGVEVDSETTGNSGSSGSGGSGNGGSSGNKDSIDFDDLLGKGDETKPTTGGNTETTKPETTTPEATTPSTTTPSTTAPDEDTSGGEKPQPGDIDVPIN